MTEPLIVTNKDENRVIMKLSGEALGREDGEGIGTEAIKRTAKDFAVALQEKPELQIAVVVGGGNMIRGKELADEGFGRGESDYIGMLGTVMNALALRSALGQLDIEARVMSAIAMDKVCEPFIPLRAINHMQKGYVVIFAAGMGIPYLTTDTTAALRALEVGASKILMAKNGTDGVYDADPRKDKTARRFQTLTFDAALKRRLAVMDTTSMALCQENDLPIDVFDMKEPGSITRALLGEKLGTYVANDVRTKFYS